MGRTPNKQRPSELLAAIVRYLTKHGLSDLSLRPLAKAVGSSPRVLLYYFGSKEKLIVEVLADIRRRQFSGFGRALEGMHDIYYGLEPHRIASRSRSSKPDNELAPRISRFRQTRSSASC